MSHFTVMVIGENAKAQLAPYDENIEVTPYKNSEDGEETTYNPKSKWDWYVLGGRWSGFLKCREGVQVGRVGLPGALGNTCPEGHADALKKRDIDVEGMRNEAEAHVREKLTKVAATGVKRDWLSWDYLCNVAFKGNIEAARDAYHAQPQIATIRKALDQVFSDVDQYLETDEVLLKRARDGALATFAFVKDGEWVERGEMGWFACVAGEKAPDDWNAEFNKMFDALPPDTLISIYDCHI